MAETATEVREQAQEKAQQAASKASETARAQVEQRSTEMGERVASTAGDIRSVSEQLREQGKERPAKLADQAAQQIERAGTWLRESDSDKLLSDVEDFGRRQPWVFALGGMALGIAAARFLKASSTQRYERLHQGDPIRKTRRGNGQPPRLSERAPHTPDPPPADVGAGTGIPARPAGDPGRGVGVPPVPPTGGTPGDR
jgi:hypothetical protein